MEQVPTSNLPRGTEGVEMEEDVTIEKRGPMHVDTAAGSFTVRL